MKQDDGVLKFIESLDDEIISRFQQGWIEDEYGSGWNMKMVREHHKSNSSPCMIHEPSSFDTLLILYKMLKDGN